MSFVDVCVAVAVDSNETLYGGDPKFIAEINKLCETLIGQVLDHLKGLGRDEVRYLINFFHHSALDS